MNRKAIIFWVLAILTFAPQAHADWIKGVFSEEAGIDSLERFLVVRDIDSCHILGTPIVPLGDINGDECSEVLLVRKAAGCRDTNSTFLYYGGRPPDGVSDGVYNGFNIITANIGDINDDGFDDIGNFQCVPNWRTEILLGGPEFGDSADYVIPGTYSRLCRAADLDDDSVIEFPLAPDMGTHWLINIYHIGPTGVDTVPEYILADTSRNFGDNLATGDFNGDGYPDLAVAASLNRDTSFVEFYWGGPSFDTVPDFKIWRKAENFGLTMLPLGDFNGDGYEDIFIDGGVADGWSIPCGVFFGGPNIDNTLDIVTNGFHGGYLCSTSASVADVNHDGYPDLIIGNDYEVGFVFEVKVFLGGPKADSIYDIYLENMLITRYQVNLGAVVAGIGDFNGDGIDDFAARSRTMLGCCWWGEVNFFAGWDSNGSDVDYEFEPTYPKIFNLRQNYPNPFNPSTTIAFDLPRHSHARLEVYNLLGERVVTLLDRDLPAGGHRVTWNGADSFGRTAASGIYFYRLTAGDYSQTRKMMLMK